MNDERVFPGWQERYRQGGVEAMPWYWPALDRDLEAALRRLGVASGRVLDLGTGPGTQAIALAERGFAVTGTDVAAAAIEYAARSANERKVKVTWTQDDILATRLTGPYDMIFDRGCFHVIHPASRGSYVRTIQRLLAPSGWLFLKTFSHLQPGDLGPYRFRPEEIRALFDADQGFEVVELFDSDFQGQLDPYPKALFAAIRRI
jgi:2-polyprenyl-3-methyl-5-hydroxy-6-metoxy-1,4-benzoquinol methylase